MRITSVVILLIAFSVQAWNGNKGSLSQQPPMKLKTEAAKDVQPKKPESAVARIMHRKLAYSERVLEGIAMGDFAAITKNADELIVLSKTAEWRVFRTPQYLTYSDEFRRTANALVQNAKAKNLDAATLSYVEMTLNCVRCHKYVREVRSARREGDPLEGATAASTWIETR